MGDSFRHHHGGEETPDSPLVFSVPTSLQEYMSRYVGRSAEHAPAPPSTAALYPEPSRMQHVSDRGSTPSNAANARPTSSSPLRATATAYHARPAATRVSSARATPHDSNASEPPMGIGVTAHSDNTSAWSARTGPPTLGQVDATFEGEGHPWRRQWNGNSNRSGSGGGVGRRRVQPRSASREGRPQSSTEVRRSDGGVNSGGADVGDGWSGGGTQEPLSPMDAAAAHDRSSHGGNGGDGGNSWFDVPGQRPAGMRRAHAAAIQSRHPPGWPSGGRGALFVGERQRETGEHPDGDQVNSSLRDEVMASQMHRGRRSLSDFLREVEEMVRRQRAEGRDPDQFPPRPQTAPQPSTGAHSHRVAATARGMAAIPPQGYPTSGSYDGRNATSGPHIGGTARYVPPGRRQMRRAAADAHLPYQPPVGTTAAARTETSPFHHPTVYDLPGGNTAPPSGIAGRTRTLPNPTYTPRPFSTPAGYGAPTLPTSAVAAATATATQRTATNTAVAAHGGRPPVPVPLSSSSRLSAAATAFSMSPGGYSAPDQNHHEASAAAEGGISGLAGTEEDLARQERWSHEWTMAVQQHALHGLSVGDGAGAHAQQQHGDSPAAAAGHRQPGNPDGSSGLSPQERFTQAQREIYHGGPLQQGRHGPFLQMVPLSRMTALPSEAGTADGGGTAPPAMDGSYDDRVGEAIQQDQDSAQGHLAVLPAFRHWESQRARLRIQWHEPANAPEVVPMESPGSDGTLVVTEHLPSNGPSRRGFDGNGARQENADFRSGGGGGGGGGDDVSKVEEALFSCLMSLDIRRLLMERGKGVIPRAGNHRRCMGSHSSRTELWTTPHLHSLAWLERCRDFQSKPPPHTPIHTLVMGSAKYLTARD
ncbi:unnamed protein product, partial [Ectocarpus sp. 4 AP-2014]